MRMVKKVRFVTQENVAVWRAADETLALRLALGVGERDVCEG